jgi:tetratricopeptide (TPR) repeat protein
LIDLRVEDHPRPVQELKHLLAMYRAYEYMNAGDLAVEKGELPRALELYGKAESLFPDHMEMRYWHAVSLFNAGMKKEAMPIFKSIFEKEPNWQILTRRLPGVGLLNADEGDFEKWISPSWK